MLPCDHNDLRAEVTQREPYEVYPSQFLQYDVEKLLSKLLHKELSFAIQLELVK
jgi:Ca2+-binding EF-hand superfamily protein